MNVTLAALCISALVQQAPGHSVATRCPAPLETGASAIHEQPLPKAVEPVPAAPDPVQAPAKAKPKPKRQAKPTCKPPKHRYYHRRGSKTWYTCT